MVKSTVMSDAITENEICHILNGTATITEPDDSSFDIGPGSLFVTPKPMTNEESDGDRHRGAAAGEDS